MTDTTLVGRLRDTSFFSDQLMANRSTADADLIDRYRAERKEAAAEIERLTRGLANEKSEADTYARWWREQRDARIAAESSLSEAVKAEREACAKVADDHTPGKHEFTLAAHVVGLTIASTIRARAVVDSDKV